VLGTVLEKIQVLLSKNFVIASFFPMLIFWTLNAAMLFWTNETLRKWTEVHIRLEGAASAVYLATALGAIGVTAYIFSTLNLTLREVLEGQHWPPRVAQRMEALQRTRLDQLSQNIDSYRRQRRRLKYELPTWQEELRMARLKGAEHATCDYAEPAERIRNLQSKMASASPIAFEDLRQAVDELKRELAHNSAELPHDPNSRALDGDHQRLLRIAGYALEKVETQYFRLFNYRQFSYPHGTVAPTAMGNIAASVRSYADSRYSLNLDLVWTRLQKIIQGDEKFFAVLQDSKTQLDFLVALFWSTVAYSLFWGAIMPLAGFRLRHLQLIWIGLGIIPAYHPLILLGGVALAVIWYAIALQNYRAFADLLRSAVDLYRLDLLKFLHLPLPKSPAEERELWEALTQWTGYGEDVKIPLTHS
jgi:hypothetical protein